jgi:hypothetical protein
MCNLTDHLESSKMEIKKPALEYYEKTHGKRVRTGLEKKENKILSEQKMGKQNSNNKYTEVLR